MKFLDLFTGIGGFTLGLKRAGMSPSGFCEIDPYCQALIKEKHPQIPLWRDITKLNDYLQKAWMSLPQDSHAKMSAKLDKARGYSTKNPPEKPSTAQDSLGRLYEPFAWYDRGSSCWRTWQQSLTEVWEEFSEPWPPAGMMHNGIAYLRAGSVGGICEKDSTPWPTPTASDYKGASSGCRKIRDKEISMLRYFLHFHFAKPHQKTSYPNPSLLEKMMGYPIGHTELKDLAMLSTLKKLKSLEDKLCN